MSSIIRDVDVDGFLDILFVNQLSNSLTIYWGNGSGAFGASSTLSIGRSGGGIDVGDLDKNGLLDIVVSNQDYNNIRVSMQTSPRTFAAASTISQSGFPTAIAILDVNRDGKLDVIVDADHGGCQVLRLGDGNGGLQAGACLAGVAQASLKVGDLDGDGWSDVVWRAASPERFVIGKFNAQGALGSTTDVPTTVASMGGFAVYDLDGDGKLDLVGSGSLAGSPTVVRLINKGGLSFSECAYGPLLGTPNYSSGYGDLNKDGKIDFSSQTTCSFCSSTHYIGLGQ